MGRPIERVLGIHGFGWFNLLFWSFACLMEVIQTATFSSSFEFSFDPQFLIRWPLSTYLVYWALSHATAFVYIASIRLSRSRFLGMHLLSSFIFAVVSGFSAPLTALLLERLFYESTTFSLASALSTLPENPLMIVSGLAVYWVIILIFHGLYYYQKFQAQNARTLDLERDLGSARLKQMKMQLHPHFLFNAFNTISMMVRQDKRDEAVEMISNLSDMLRQSLTRETNQFVLLKEEIQIVKKFLSIESYRFADRLNITWDIDDQLNNVKIPSLLLQPIVENAFKHGISKSMDNSQLHIKCYKNNEDQLILEVFNSGPSFPEEWDFQKTKGIGLANTSERLARLYNKDYKFLIEERDNGINVIIQIPVNSSNE